MTKNGIISLGVMIIMFLTIMLASCSSQEIRPDGIDDPMPENWENDSYVYNSQSSADIDISLFGKNEVTVKINQGFSYVRRWTFTGSLENIYVEEGHPEFVSIEGVLYTKSLQTLVRWPERKPVTMPESTIKYFAPNCYMRCKMPTDFELPDGTISIGGSAFYESSLSKIHIKRNVKTVGRGAITSESLKTVEISSPIAYLTFFSSPYLETVIFNEGVTQLRVGTEQITRRIDIMLNLSNVNFPKSLEVIGNINFPVSMANRKYVLEKNITFLDKFAFHDFFSNDSIILKDFYSGERWRKGKTEFEFSNEIAREYFEERILKWENNWIDFILWLKDKQATFKKQGEDATAKDIEEYITSLTN